MSADDCNSHRAVRTTIGTYQFTSSSFFKWVKGFKDNFNVKKPKIPAVKEARRITNFELLIIFWSSNANNVINIDIVNPIPPNKPTPKIDLQFRFFGSLQIPNVTAKKVTMKMPNGLPTTNPIEIPKL